jgi:hypothetical protein
MDGTFLPMKSIMKPCYLKVNGWMEDRLEEWMDAWDCVDGWMERLNVWIQCRRIKVQCHPCWIMVGWSSGRLDAKIDCVDLSMNDWMHKWMNESCRQFNQQTEVSVLMYCMSKRKMGLCGWMDGLCRQSSCADGWMARSSVGTNKSALSMHHWMNEWMNE